MSDVARPYGLKRPDITAAGTKATPVSADKLVLVNSEDGDALATVSWSTLETAFGGGGASSPLTLTAGGVAEVPLTIEAAAGQTGNLLELNSSSASDGDLVSISAEGHLRLPTGAFNNRALEFGSSQYGIAVHSSGLYLVAGNANCLHLTTNRCGIKSGDQFTWSTSGSFATNADTGLKRSSAGVVQVTNGSTGTGDLLVGELSASSPTRDGLYTFSTVPTASSYEHHRIVISDRSSRAAYSDGTNWRFESDDAVIS